MISRPFLYGELVRYPNQRYGKASELAYYAMGRSDADLARMLRRDERTVRDWMTGRRKVPFWVPELLRLRAWEAAERHRQMGFEPLRRGLGLVSGDVIELRRPEAKKPEPIGSRLIDLDQALSTRAR
jgi:hypothetical protein